MQKEINGVVYTFMTPDAIEFYNNKKYLSNTMSKEVRIVAHDDKGRVLNINLEVEFDYTVQGDAKISLSKSGPLAANLYTKQTLLMEKDKKIKDAITELLNTTGSTSILVKKIPESFDKESYVCFLDFNPDALPREYIQYSARTVTGYAAKTIKTTPEEDNALIGSILEKTAASFFIKKEIEAFAKKTLSEDLTIGAHSLDAMASKDVEELYEAVFVRENGRSEELYKVFMSDEDDVDAILGALRSETPVQKMRELISKGMIVSPRILQDFKKSGEHLAPLIDAEYLNAEEAKQNKETTHPLLAPISLCSPETIKTSIDAGAMTAEDFLFPYEEGDELLGISDEYIPATLSMCDYGGQARLNGIIKTGFVDDNNRETVAKELFHVGHIVEKAIMKLDTSSPKAMETLKQYLASDYSKAKTFAIKSPVHDNLVYVFVYNGPNNMMTKPIPTPAMLMGSVIEPDRFYAQRLELMKILNSPIEPSLASYGVLAAGNMNYAEKAFAYSILSPFNTRKELEKWKLSIQNSHLVIGSKQKKKLQYHISKLPSETILGTLSVANVNIKEKIFPDLLHPMSKRFHSLEDISKNFILATRYLQLPGFSETILQLLKANKLPFPKTQHFVLNLEHPELNDLKDRKDFVSAPGESLGVLNYKYVPAFIDVESTGAKSVFLKNVEESMIAAADEYEADVTNDAIKIAVAAVSETIKDAKYVIMKTTKVYDSDKGMFTNREHFVSADENLSDIGFINLEPMYFFETLKKNGILDIDHRIEEVRLSGKAASAMFEAIDGFVTEAYNKLKDRYLDEKSIEIIDSLAKASIGKGVPSIPDSLKTKLFSQFFKNSVLVDFTKSIIGENKDPRVISHEALKEASKIGVEIESISEEIEFIEHFLTARFYGKEYKYGLVENRFANKEMFDLYFKDKDYSELLWSQMMGISTYDDTIKNAVIRLAETFMLKRYIDLIKDSGDEIKNDFKSNVISTFLLSSLGLSNHQLIEVKSFASSVIDGTKNMELLFWEMRTGKTRTMIATLLLLSLIKKENSIFFVQGKNYDDIISQAFEMNPLIVSEASVFVENQSRFNADTYTIPVPLSHDIYPNIPRALKMKHLLRNPDPSDPVNPSVRLSDDFVERFQSIVSAIGDDLEGEYAKYEAFVSQEYPEGAKHLLHPSTRREDSFKNAIASGYYILWLANQNYIERDAETAKTASKKVFTEVIDMISKERSRYDARHGQIIFSSKKHIDSFSAEEVPGRKVYEPQFTKTLSVRSALQVDATLSRKKEDPVDVRDKKEGKTRDKELDEGFAKTLFALKTSETLRPFTSAGKVVFPVPLDEKEYIFKGGSKTRSDIVAFILQYAKSRFVATAGEKLAEVLDTLSDQAVKDRAIAAFDSATGTVFNGYSKVILTNIGFTKWHLDGTYPALTIDGNTGHACSMMDLEKIDLTANVSHAIRNILAPEDASITDFIQRKLFNATSLAEALNFGGYAYCAMTLLTRARYRNIGTLIENRLLGSDKAQSMEMRLEFMPLDEIAMPLYKERNKDTGSYNLIQDVIAFTTTANSTVAPHQYGTVPVSVRTMTLSLKSGLIDVAIDNVVPLDNDSIYVRNYVNTSSSLSSKFFWKIEKNSNISSIAIDETHKNAKGKSAFQTKGMLSGLDELYPGSTKICATGTPLSGIQAFASLIETISDSKGAQISKMIQKYCGNFRYRSEAIALISKACSSDGTFTEILNTAVIKLVESGHDENLVEAAWKHDEIIDALTKTDGEFSDTVITYSDFCKAYDEVMQTAIGVYNREKNKTLSLMAETEEEKNTIAVETLVKSIAPVEEALFGEGLSLTVPTAGFNNPSVMASAISYMDNANASIRRPSKNIKYDIPDKSHLDAKNSTKWAHDGGPGHKAASAILAFDAAGRKYARNNLISKIKETLMFSSKALCQAMLYDPSLIGMHGTQEASLAVLRSQKTVNDGVDDYYEAMLNTRHLPIFTDSKKALAFGWMIEKIEVFCGSISELKKQAAKARDTGEKTFKALIGGDGLTFATEAILEIEGYHHAPGSNSIFFNTTKEELKHRQKAVIFKDGLPWLRANDGDEEIHFRIPVAIDTLGENLPKIEFDFNPSNRDDRSITEAMAFEPETTRLLLEKVNAGDNTRLMTTRVAITQLAVAISIKAALQREDCSAPFNVIINATDKRIADYIGKIQKECGGRLEEKNLKLWVESPSTINMALQEVNGKKEQLSIVGHYISLAEGYNMEFVKWGFYLGAVGKAAEAIQSFARQIGYSSTTSSFYLCNDGALASLIPDSTGQKPATDNISMLLGATISDKSAESVYKNALMVSGDLKVGRSYIKSVNSIRYKDLVAYEKFVNGNLISEGDITKKLVESWVYQQSANISIADIIKPEPGMKPLKK